MREGDRVVSYSELMHAVEHNSRLLHALPRGARIGISCSPGLDQAIAALAVLRAEMTFIPLDPRIPSAQLGKTAARFNLGAVMCVEDERSRFGAEIVRLADHDDIATCGNWECLNSLDVYHRGERKLDGKRLAYVMPTSGSTGVPKGVVQSERNMVDNAILFGRSVGMTSGTRMPVFCSLSVDSIVLELIAPLLHGALVEFVPIGAVDGTSVVQRLTQLRPTVIHCTPTQFRYLASLADYDSAALCFPEIRYVAFGGEQLRLRDIEIARRVLPSSTTVINGLGFTECTIALQYKFAITELVEDPIPVGTPIGDTLVDLGRTNSYGAASGELVIQSSRVAHGYLNEDELTRERFSGNGVCRTYRTRDLITRGEDGLFRHDGRLDDEVKVRGFRVQLRAIENQLRLHPSVAMACVFCVEDDRGERILKAFVSPTTALGLSVGNLIDYLSQQLPEQCIPHDWQILSKFPMGSSGKVDRRELLKLGEEKAPDFVESSRKDEQELEASVRAIWERVIGRTFEDDLDLSFLAAGGDSIMRLRVLELINRELRSNLTVQDVVRARTIRRTAELIRTRSNGMGLDDGEATWPVRR
jgi:acyl-coenzyme A synthetase/AMP-(fatty) acid ligase